MFESDLDDDFEAMSAGTAMPGVEADHAKTDKPDISSKAPGARKWLGPTEGPMLLAEIKMKVVVFSIHGKFFQPLKSFLKQMNLEWGNAGTACAFRRNKLPVIQLGRKFFADTVKTPHNGAQIVLHEIMHHLMLHLVNYALIHAKGYSKRVVNVAEDAIINAYLAYVNCASFMQEFYPDKGYYAFLRPNSRNIFVLPENKGTEENARRDTNDPGYVFYQRLMKLDISLEESLEFFHTYFQKADDEERPMLGSHDKPQDGDEGEPDSGDSIEGEGGQPQPSQGEEGEDGSPSNKSGEGETGKEGKDGKPGDQAGEEGENRSPGDALGGLFGQNEASAILRSMGIGKVSNSARDNFRKIISTITQSANRPGALRHSPAHTRRVPFKLTTRDMFNIERGRELFPRFQYLRRTFDVMIDVSGSVDRYIPFVVGLVRSLRASEHDVRVHCWADCVEEVPLQALGTTAQPAVGGGTNGELVAQYIAQRHITHAVIITDNAAGTVSTPIKATVYLCLFHGKSVSSSLSGSFLDKSVVPHCRVHKLRVDDQYNW